MDIDACIWIATSLEAGRYKGRISGTRTLAMVRALTAEAVASRRISGAYDLYISDLLRAASRLTRHCRNIDCQQRADAMVTQAYNYMQAAQ